MGPVGDFLDTWVCLLGDVFFAIFVPILPCLPEPKKTTHDSVDLNIFRDHQTKSCFFFTLPPGNRHIQCGIKIEYLQKCRLVGDMLVCLKVLLSTPRYTNITMGNPTFEDVLPIGQVGFPLLC